MYVWFYVWKYVCMHKCLFNLATDFDLETTGTIWSGLWLKLLKTFNFYHVLVVAALENGWLR